MTLVRLPVLTLALNSPSNFTTWAASPTGRIFSKRQTLVFLKPSDCLITNFFVQRWLSKDPRRIGFSSRHLFYPPFLAGKIMIVTDLPLELVEYTLFSLDPLDVACLAQTCRFFKRLIYGAKHQRFWRGLYLAQSLDDPQSTLSYLGNPRRDIDWRGELQRIIRARTVAKNLSICRPEERCQVLQTLLDMIINVPPLPQPESDPISYNVHWVHRLLRESPLFDHEEWVLTPEEEQLRARLHVLYGLTDKDGDADKRLASRAFVYSRRNHTTSNGFGPFMTDGSMRVNWVHMEALARVIVPSWMEVEGQEEDDIAHFESCPMGVGFCQNIIPPGLNLDEESDWAGVEGLWMLGYCFLDHREFLIYNDPNIPEDEPLDTTILEDPQEIYSAVPVYFRVTSVEDDPDHPKRPKINYIGEMDGKCTIIGYVKLTPDNQVWWHWGAGNDGQAVWNCEGIALGGVRSQCGVLGIWSTVFHDAEDPLGPFWLQRQNIIED